MKNILLLIFFVLLTYYSQSQIVSIPNPISYPAPVSLSQVEIDQLGKLMPRTMNLLHSGGKVKIAAYGQSLSDGNNTWWQTLRDALKAAYPDADIDVRTYGVGGVASDRLWRLTNQELVAYCPDLVIFHVYGNHLFYETIVRQIRGCTAAEMIIQGDHFGRYDGTGTAGSWNYNLSDMGQWDNQMSFVFVKGYCDTYKIERDNRRQEWYDYIRANNYVPGQLLADDIHFNTQGQYLVAALTARHFVYRSEIDEDPDNLVQYYEVGTDVLVENDTITLPFEGNKIELIPEINSSAVISATIDGKKPSEFSNCYYFTIPTGGFWAGAPFLRPGMGIQQAEDWTITMTGGGNFSLSGSLTGADGTGNINNVFISNSKRVVLNKKSDWGNYGNPPTSGTFAFKSKGMFNEEIDFDTVTIVSGKENAINLVQGLGNTNHILKLASSDNTFPIKSIKVYKPFYKLSVTVPSVVDVSPNGGTATIPVQGNTFWQVSHNSARLGALNKWNNITLSGADDFSIDNNTINITCNVPALTGDSAIEYVSVYGQGCDVKTVKIRQKAVPVAINSISDRIQIYPNPTEDLVVIENLKDVTKVEIFNSLGNLVKTAHVSDNNFSMEGLPSGVYLTKFSSDNKGYQKIIIKK